MNRERAEAVAAGFMLLALVAAIPVVIIVCVVRVFA